MNYLKKFEDFVTVEYVDAKPQHSSYKNDEKKKRKKKNGVGTLEPVSVMSNKTKDEVSFQAKF